MTKTVDLHTHTNFSFDILNTPAAPESMAQAATNIGLQALALTDHLEVNSEYEGIYAPFDFAARRRACLAAKESSSVPILVGIELGQPTHYPSLAEKFLASEHFEIVLGSIHNIKDTPDFALIDYTGFSEDDYISLWEKYLDEYLALTKFDGIDSLAHLTYPLRYFKKVGFELDLKRYEDKITRILLSAIASGKALEINSSGYRQGIGSTLPDEYVISLYASLGGRLVTTGSDAHTAGNVGCDIDKAEALVQKYKLQICDWRKFL